MKTGHAFRAKVLATLVIAAIVFPAGHALAQSYDPDQTIPKPTILEKRLTKLGRGLANVFFGWAEIPLTFDKKMRQGKPLTYLLAAVPVLGTTRALMRTGLGVYEVFTFPSTKPHVNYEALIEPDFIF